MKNALTILFGILLIAILAPISQFCTVAMTNHDMETSAASGWVFGILFSLILAGVALRLVSKTFRPQRQSLVILFGMLALAVPVMNLGVVRLLLSNLLVIQEHFVGFGVDTYRRAHQEQNPDWFPVVPTTEGLAYQKADQIFKLVQDNRLLKQRQEALNRATLALQGELRRLERGEAPRAEALASVVESVPQMGLRELERFRQSLTQDAAAQAWGGEHAILGKVDEELALRRKESEAARIRMSAYIGLIDERLLYFAPSVRGSLDRSALGRLKKLEARIGESEAEALRAAAATMETEHLTKLREDLRQMGEGDVRGIREQRRNAYLQELLALDESRVAEMRSDFVYRLRTQERRALMAQTAEDGIPGHDLAAVKDGVFRTAADQNLRRENSFADNLGFVWNRVSWSLWVRPLLHWGGLLLLLFLFLMCLAEFLRRKWVERENLAFPLVDVADHLIRHDFKMETAEDLLNPEARKGQFAPAFWVGFALGVLMLGLEAFAHYNGTPSPLMAMDVNKTLFADGGLKELNKLVFVLSPILLGLFFLVSLEISFSVWAVYFIFRLVFLAIGQATQGQIRDAGHVGYAGARFFPFEQEQLLGAGLCLGLLMLIKAWGAGKGRPVPNADHNRYLPSMLTRIGLCVLPVAIYLLLRDMGVSHPGFFLFFGGIFVLLAVAAARLRAETGLPMQHVNYDFTRIPLAFGLAQSMSVKSLLNFFSLVFLPVTLMSRLLPQQLENLELARRHHVRGRTMAIAAVLAFVTALGVGMLSLLLLSHGLGGEALGIGAVKQGAANSSGIVSYPMWVSHFLGEEGITSFVRIHKTRLLFVGIGAGVFGLLTFLRGRLLRFPFHPMGYILLLFSIYHSMLSPYFKGTDTYKVEGASWLWGSAFVAWALKSLIVKYGGMNTYRAAKPAFVGLIVGSLFAMFAVNVVDIATKLRANRNGFEPSATQKKIIEAPAFTPKVY